MKILHKTTYWLDGRFCFEAMVDVGEKIAKELEKPCVIIVCDVIEHEIYISDDGEEKLEAKILKEATALIERTRVMKKAKENLKFAKGAGK